MIRFISFLLIFLLVGCGSDPFEHYIHYGETTAYDSVVDVRRTDQTIHSVPGVFSSYQYSKTPYLAEVETITVNMTGTCVLQRVTLQPKREVQTIPLISWIQFVTSRCGSIDWEQIRIRHASQDEWETSITAQHLAYHWANEALIRAKMTHPQIYHAR